MGCCIRNCYGIELDEIKDRVKESIPNLLLDFLLDLTKCTNSQSQKNGLANWNKLNIFTANKVFDKLDDLDNNGGYLDLSSPEKIFESILEGLINEFNDLMCNGGSSGLEDLDNKYNTDKDGNPIIKFPGGMTDNDKDKIKDLIDDNNFFDDNLNGGGNNSSGGNIVVDRDDSNNNENDDNYFGGGNGGNNNGNGNNGGGNGGNGNNGGSNGGSDLDSGTGNGGGNADDGNGPIWNIPNDEISDVDLITQIYKCFTPVFHIENYIFSTVKTKTPIFLTNTRLKRIKRIHNEILLPIFYHYFGEDAKPTCQIRITFCLSSYANIVEFIGGEAHSKHLTGEAVDISIVGISSEKVISDIRNKILNVDFGVLYDKGGLHFTLPYTFENLDVRRMYLSSPKKSRNSLEIEFI